MWRRLCSTTMTQQRVPGDTGGSTDEYAYMTTTSSGDDVARVFQADGDHPFAATAGLRGETSARPSVAVYAKSVGRLYSDTYNAADIAEYSVPSDPTETFRTETSDLSRDIGYLESMCYDPLNDNLVIGGYDNDISSYVLLSVDRATKDIVFENNTDGASYIDCTDNGEIYGHNVSAGTLYEYDSDGVVQQSASGPANVSGLVLDASGAIYVCDSGNEDVVVYDGSFSEVARASVVNSTSSNPEIVTAAGVADGVVAAAGGGVFRVRSDGTVPWRRETYVQPFLRGVTPAGTAIFEANLGGSFGGLETEVVVLDVVSGEELHSHSRNPEEPNEETLQTVFAPRAGAYPGEY
jgi:hypothetical protein